MHPTCCKGASAGSHSPRLLPPTKVPLAGGRAEINAAPPPATSSRCAATSCSTPPMLPATEAPLAGGNAEIKAACHRGASPESYGMILLHPSNQFLSPTPRTPATCLRGPTCRGPCRGQGRPDTLMPPTLRLPEARPTPHSSPTGPLLHPAQR